MDGLCNVPKLQFLSRWPFKDHGQPGVTASDIVADSTNPIPTRCPALQMNSSVRRMTYWVRNWADVTYFQMLCRVCDVPYLTEVFTDLLKALCERAFGVNRYDCPCGIPKAKMAAQLRLMGVPHPIMEMKQGYGGVEGGAKISRICKGSLIVGLNHSRPEFGSRPKFPD
jgi:hypothetical protein